MCGIFGLLVKKDANYKNKFLKKSFMTLANLSQSRGKDSSGLCSLNYKFNSLDVIKGPIPISKLLKRKKSKLNIDFQIITIIPSCHLVMLD